MKSLKKFAVFLFSLVFLSNVSAQYAKTDSTYKRWFVGSTIFLLRNLASTNSPDFVQLNLGYRITGKDIITLEPKTWKYAWPNGIHPFLKQIIRKAGRRISGVYSGVWLFSGLPTIFVERFICRT